MAIKRFCIIMLVLCAAATVIPLSLFAQNYVTELPEDMDKEYIIERIVSMADGFIDGLRPVVTRDDVDLSKAYKIYVGGNIFRLPTNNLSEIVAFLEGSHIIYLVPVKIGGDTFVANISRRMPVNDNLRRVLSVEELMEFEERVGTWIVSGMEGYAEGEIENYYERAARVSGRTDVQPILVGGQPGFRLTIALYPDDAGNVGEIVAVRPASVAWDSLGLSREEYENKPIRYDVAKEAVLSIPPSNPELTGGGSGNGYIGVKGSIPQIMLIAVGALVFIVVCRSVYANRHREKLWREAISSCNTTGPEDAQT